MKKVNKIRYTDDKGEIGRIQIVPDFLPSPEELARRMSKVKVTLELNATSLEFFKREAKKHRVPYQRMIREVVNAYVERKGR